MAIHPLLLLLLDTLTAVHSINLPILLSSDTISHLLPVRGWKRTLGESYLTILHRHLLLGSICHTYNNIRSPWKKDYYDVSPQWAQRLQESLSFHHHLLME